MLSKFWKLDDLLTCPYRLYPAYPLQKRLQQFLTRFPRKFKKQQLCFCKNTKYPPIYSRGCLFPGFSESRFQGKYDAILYFPRNKKMKLPIFWRYLHIMNPEEKVLPQIRAKHDPKQDSLVQVIIHMPVFIQFLHTSPVLTFNQRAKRNWGITLHKYICWLVAAIHTDTYTL